MKPSNPIIPATYTTQRAWDVAVMEEYRAHHGELGGLSPQLVGSRILILTTKGRKSGQDYSVPLSYIEEHDQDVVFASRAGTDRHPLWYFNVLADPNVTIEKFGETYPAQATAFEQGPERERLYGLLIAALPRLAEYTKMTSRTIPIVTFSRSS